MRNANYVPIDEVTRVIYSDYCNVPNRGYRPFPHYLGKVIGMPVVLYMSPFYCAWRKADSAHEAAEAFGMEAISNDDAIALVHERVPRGWPSYNILGLCNKITDGGHPHPYYLKEQVEFHLRVATFLTSCIFCSHVGDARKMKCVTSNCFVCSWSCYRIAKKRIERSCKIRKSARDAFLNRQQEIRRERQKFAECKRLILQAKRLLRGYPPQQSPRQDPESATVTSSAHSHLR